MSDELLAALRPVLDHFSSYLQDKPGLRQQLSSIARTLADWVESSPVVPLPAVAEIKDAPPAPESLRPETAPVILPSSVKPFLVPTIPNYSEQGREFIPLPLATVATRCRIKAAAAGLVAKRSIGPASADAATEEANLRKQADAIPDCGLWMFDSSGGSRAKAIWDDLAGGFAVCAAAADLLRSWTAAGSDLASGQEVLTLAAEAQSMLLYAVADVGWVSRDHEQVQLFVHIRELGKQLQIYVPRFLRREDPADPAKWPELLLRLKAAVTRIGLPGQPAASGDPTKVRQKALGNLKFKLKKLADEPSGIADEWPRLVELLDQAVSAGVPPNSPELCDGMLPIYEQLPENLPVSAAAERVFRHVESTRKVPPESEETTDTVSRILPGHTADGLRGKELIVIGVVKRPQQLAALRHVFALTEAKWVNATEPTELTAATALVNRAEIVAVIVTTRWTNHDFDDLRQACARLGKAFITARPDEPIHDLVQQIVTRTRVQMETAASDGFSAGL